MRSPNRSLSLIAAILTFLVTASIIGPTASAQRRVVEDKSSVKVTTRAPRTINRGPKSVRNASRASNGILIVLTDPPGATVSIDGRVAGKSDTDGEFQVEKPANRNYAVKVSAGPEYVPFSDTVKLTARGTEIVRAALPTVNASKYGAIKIGPVIDGTRVFLDGKPVADVAIDRAENFMTLDKVPPGVHTVRWDNPDYLIVEKKFPGVEAGNEYLWILTPEFATVELSVATDPGTKIYVDNELKGDTAADGKASVPDVRLGSHEVKLVKDGYVEYAETREFVYGNPVAISKRLVPLPTSAEFSDDFDVNMSKWAPVSGLSLKTGRLQVSNAPKLAYATNIVYRDFVEAFHLRLEDGAGAAWAVRAKDENNYYLFYVSGPKGLFPGRFNTYIVKDGKFDPMNPVQSIPVITDFRAKGEYQIEIEGKKDVIEHFITPAETGKREPIAVFQDKDQTYLYGGIGFRSVGNEMFSIDDLFVQPRGN